MKTPQMNPIGTAISYSPTDVSHSETGAAFSAAEPDIKPAAHAGMQGDSESGRGRESMAELIHLFEESHNRKRRALSGNSMRARAARIYVFVAKGLDTAQSRGHLLDRVA